VGVAPDGTQYLVEQDSPLQEGHAVVLYCAGLGPVSPSVPEGAAAPLEPLSQTSNPVTLTIGGQQATVLFAGLAPGFAGLYQVNALVPAGVEKGPEVPVILSLAGQPSPPVTLPMQ
jgi:adhesin/invasin